MDKLLKEINKEIAPLIAKEGDEFGLFEVSFPESKYISCVLSCSEDFVSLVEKISDSNGLPKPFFNNTRTLWWY